jgi:cytochrome c peroxidase
VSNGFFNPPADDHVFNPVRIPTLRGIRYLAPYGRDGRIASLREFTRNVIVAEFGGAAMQRDRTLRSLGGLRARPVAPPGQTGSNEKQTPLVAG